MSWLPTSNNDILTIHRHKTALELILDCRTRAVIKPATRQGVPMGWHFIATIIRDQILSMLTIHITHRVRPTGNGKIGAVYQIITIHCLYSIYICVYMAITWSPRMWCAFPRHLTFKGWAIYIYIYMLYKGWCCFVDSVVAHQWIFIHAFSGRCSFPNDLLEVLQGASICECMVYIVYI